MESVFQNKYKIASNRLCGWNYASDGHYFITIVTANKENHFGKIMDDKMIMNDWGQIVYDEFFKSFEMRQELYLGGFVLMPNHIHAIVSIVETHGRASSPKSNDGPKSNNTTKQLIRQPQSISSFIAGFKSATIKHIDDWIDINNPNMPKFNRRNPLWQPNYYDHIIRSEKEYMQISGYIVDNPLHWEKDRNKTM